MTLALEVERSLSVKSEQYGWDQTSSFDTDLPLALLDVDGTLRGELKPMIRLARLLAPKWRRKLNGEESLNFYKCKSFCRNIGGLWKCLQDENNRLHYKPLFSELHIAAASLLHRTPVQKQRLEYRSQIELMNCLWSPGAIHLLRKLTSHMNVVLVTGSEQLQTEECVRQLSRYGVRLDRIAVRGSLYGIDGCHRFNGRINRLNITAASKRHTVADLAARFTVRVALGNSGADRALFEAVADDGVRCMVVPSRKRSRQPALTRSGYNRNSALGLQNMLFDDQGLSAIAEHVQTQFWNWGVNLPHASNTCMAQE
jgi:phosphoserine phosphatase